MAGYQILKKKISGYTDSLVGVSPNTEFEIRLDTGFPGFSGPSLDKTTAGNVRIVVDSAEECRKLKTRRSDSQYIYQSTREREREKRDSV